MTVFYQRFLFGGLIEPRYRCNCEPLPTSWDRGQFTSIGMWKPLKDDSPYVDFFIEGSIVLSLRVSQE